MDLIIDGNNIAYRSFHTPQGNLCTKAGEPTGVMLGVLHSLKVYIDKFQDIDRIVVCWDAGKAAWRKKIWPEYKANRSYGDDPEEKARFDGLFRQIDMLDEFLPKLGVNSLKVKYHEADDLIYAVDQILPPNKRIVITTDKDMLQMVSNTTHIYSPSKDRIISPLNFFEETGVDLKAYIGYRALLGDPSDNIPGIQGIGEKTAKSLMDKFGHIDNVLGATGEDKAALLKSSRTKKIFDPANLQILGRNHKLMNFNYVDYSQIEEHIKERVLQVPVVDSKAVKEFLMRWQFISILTNYMPFIISFRTIGGSTDCVS